MISIGIDVSKGKSTVCFLKPFGEVIYKPFEVQHTESDLNSLVEKIRLQKEEVRVVMESTGAYHYPILTYLLEHDIFVSVINALVINKYINVSLRKSKTDALDSIKIANYGLDYWNHLVKHTMKSDT